VPACRSRCSESSKATRMLRGGKIRGYALHDCSRADIADDRCAKGCNCKSHYKPVGFGSSDGANPTAAPGSASIAAIGCNTG
jgi:hypothetical protein